MCYRKPMNGLRTTVLALLLLCLLLWSPSLPAESLDLSTLTDDQLLTVYFQNSSERDNLLREQQNTLNTAQSQSLLALEQSSEAKRLSQEALTQSEKAVTSANASKNSIARTTESYLSWREDVNNDLKELKTQNFWLKAGMFAAMTIAAGTVLLALSR